MAGAVIGREEELGALEAFLDEVTQGPAALVLSGEAGIGKTILWEAGVGEARRRLGRVLSHRSVEVEALLSFAGLSDLLDPVFDEVAPLLAPLRREVLEVALLLVKPGEEPPDPRAIGLALLDVLRALAADGSVLVALDDVQWLDPSSAAVLQIALRRLRDERVGLLATLRKVPEVAAPFKLERAFPGERLERLWLAPLSLAALHHLLRERLSLELTRPELVRVQEASGGNPFFALELGRELARTTARPAARHALQVPESLRELLGGRLARLPAETSEVLLGAAALARPTVELLAAAQGDGEGVLEALETGVREGVVELDDSLIRFAHPLLASICYEQAPLRERRAVHRALAGVVSDVEERARHLALAAEGPDAVVASALDTAAEQAAARGATAAAAELSELAGELTPDDPPSARQRWLRAANFHRLAGDRDRAVALLEQLLTEVPRGVERADVIFALALTGRLGSEGRFELLSEGLDEATGDERRSARILTARSVSRLVGGDVQAALVDAREGLQKAERAGDQVGVAVAISRVGQAETYAAELTPGLLDRGAELEQRLGLQLDYRESPRMTLARTQMRLAEFEPARAALEDLEAQAAARGDEPTRVVLLWSLGNLEWFACRWKLALDYAERAAELGEQTQWAEHPGWLGRVMALVEVDLGLAERARSSAEAALAQTPATGFDVMRIFTLGVLGRLELALGNLEAAGDQLRELPGRMLAAGMNDPSQPIWADAIETLVALGELERARQYLEPYELHARRFGSPWARAGATRCRGLLAAAERDLTPALAAFESSLVLAEPFPLEYGRTLLCLGVVRRQAQEKKAAREVLEQALAVFEEPGARLWAEKARAELRRISGRQPAPEGLTETERRVAELAAQGRSNREIAAELFMGLSTAEAHLSRVYRKLGIHSRAALAGSLDKVGAR